MAKSRDVTPGSVPLVNEQAEVLPDGTKMYGPFGIAGWALGFQQSSDEVCATYTKWVEAGNTPDVSFVLLWTRTSVHLEHHDQRLDDLEKRLRKLERRLGATSTN